MNYLDKKRNQLYCSKACALKVLGQKYRDAEQAAHEKAQGKLGLERDAIVERVDDACLHYRQAVRRGEDEEAAWAAFQSACSEAITDLLDGG